MTASSSQLSPSLPPQISSKPQYYSLAKRGSLGNCFQTWDDIRSWRASRYRGPIRFRSRVPGSKLFTTGKPYEGAEIPRAYRAAIAAGELPENIIFCEPAPEQHLRFQGELVCTQGLLHLGWSTEPGITCREAMTRPTWSQGLSALKILEHRLDPQDREWLLSLVDAYPEHVVEFSAYAIPVGWLGSRMVIWEIRRY